MSSFTCVSCHVIFGDGDLHREHYKSEWHRYNLKRRLAELPAVTEEVFQQKLLQQEHLQADEQAAASHCHSCHKHFRTPNSLANHLKSKKHVSDNLDIGAVSLEEEVEKKNRINITKSLQSRARSDLVIRRDLPECTLASREITALQASTDRVSTSDNFKPNVFHDDDTDDFDDGSWESCDGDIESDELDDALEVTECLFCSETSATLEDNIKHMSVEHSFFIPDIEYLVDLEGLIAYLGEKVGLGWMCLWCCNKGKRFSSLLAVQQHMRDKGHCKMLHEGDALAEYADYYDYTSSYEDGANGAPNPDEEVHVQELNGDDWQLVLPSGATVGHRSLQRYYRQNLPLTPRPKNQHVLNNVMSQYKALGWTGTTSAAAVLKAKDITFMRRMQSKQLLKLGIRNNKLQHHFRPQVTY